MDGSSSTPVVAHGSRQLTIRELATLRAALRFWQAIAGDEMPRDALAAAHAEVFPVGQPADLILDADEIEGLLNQLAAAGDVVITPLLTPDAIDRRRV